MSFLIGTAFTKQFSSIIMHLSQQKKSRLAETVRNENVVGEEAFFNQIIAGDAETVSDRFADSPQIDTVHNRRRVAPIGKRWGDFIDTLDNVKSLIDPTNAYVQAAAMTMGRAKDAIIRDAATGTALTGKTGSVSTVLPSTQIIVDGGTNLTLAKLIETKAKFWTNDVDIDDPENKLFFAVSGNQLESLLGDTTITSSDFNTVKALVNGDIDSFMGFKFVRYEGLTKASDIRSTFAYAKSGITLGVNKDVTIEVTKRSDKSFAWYAFAEMSMGATRMEEVKVVQVDCDETA
jgi:hypothetical protein